MGKLGALIQQKEKEELFELAERHFPSNGEFLDSISISKSSFNDHKNGDSTIIRLSTLYNLVKVTNTTTPIFKNSNPGNFQLSSRSDSVEIEDAAQELILGYFETEELQRIFDRSAPSVKKYRRNANKYVPKEGFETSFQKMNAELSNSINLNADIFDIRQYNSGFTDSEALAEDWDEQDILEKGGKLRSLEILLESNPSSAGRAARATSAIDRMKESIYSKSLDMYEGDLYSLLSQSGHLDQWGSPPNPTCQTTASNEELELARSLIKSYSTKEVSKNEEYSDEEIVQMVKEKAEDLGATPTLSDLNEEVNYPDAYDFRSRFDGYNNLLFRASLTPNLERYGEKEIMDSLRKEYVENGFNRPDEKVLNGKDNFPTMGYLRQLYGGLDEALEEAGIPIIEANESKYFDNLENRIDLDQIREKSASSD